LPLVLALAALLLLSVSAGGAASPAAGVVAGVPDGDTLALRDGRRVRLLQIDTPELSTGECYSRAARALHSRLVPVGSAVTLEADPALDRVDRYGRLLRYVRRGALNVNLELVRRGAAAPYFFGGRRGRYAARLMAAAREAKAAHRGLWHACPRTVLNPSAPVTTRS
jgi:endonuclease YncB( thermonuclease family)